MRVHFKNSVVRRLAWVLIAAGLPNVAVAQQTPTAVLGQPTAASPLPSGSVAPGRVHQAWVPPSAPMAHLPQAEETSSRQPVAVVPPVPGLAGQAPGTTGAPSSMQMAVFQPAPGVAASPPSGFSAPPPPEDIDDSGSDSSLPTPIYDPVQAGNLELRLRQAEKQLEAMGGKPNDLLPLIKLSGFMQLDEGLFSQSAASRAELGDMQDGLGFRRARLLALGQLTDFTGYTIEVDFGALGRPSLVDIWGEQSEVPFLGTVRIGQFRQPTSMECWTSIRHLDFLERSVGFQALDPFRRVGIMAYAMSDDELTSWAYSVYGTGLTFWNGTDTTYSTLGDTRFGTQIGDRGGISVVGRVTHLLYYDEPSEGRYLLHVGGGYNFSELGGNNGTGSNASTYQARAIPEFFVGDPAGGGLTAAGTPFIVDSGRIRANNYNMFHTELAGNYGPAHFQTEWQGSVVDQLTGSAIFYHGAYFQCGYFLTGESVRYLKQAGVLDYNVTPYTDFFGLGRHARMCGWGAWEVTFRWSYLDLETGKILPVNQLSNSVGPPPSPNPGIVNESTIGLNWWWNRFTRVQFNWIHSMPDYPTVGVAPFDIFAARFQVEF
ncbi:MAG: hypothetical protein KF708_18215 [Pirellulales bacterium]|nr:hypothetical protein [Pirellulales bacterium]